MSPWQIIFQQSRVNHGPYYGDLLPAQNWDWPKGTWFQERLRYLRKAVTHGARHESETIAEREKIPARLSVVPLLLADKEISTEAHRALLEHRLEDAAEMFMQEYGLTCVEAGDLLDVSAC
jgi:hypothetical protein